ncbi:MAG: putative porin [Lentisphaeria bacterium]|nr:putative porin [Lentisphaeria bacterium]
MIMKKRWSSVGRGLIRLRGRGRCLGLLLALVVFSGGGVYAQSNDEVLRRIDQLQQQINVQQVMIDELRKALAAQVQQQQQVSEKAREEVQAAVQEAKDELAKDNAPLLALRKGIEGLDITGDLRLRYENVTRDVDSGDDVREKSRFRHRVRLGGVWKNPSEDWEIGLGLEAGSSDGTSANQSWNKNSSWESGSVYLDYAYAKHRFGDSGLSLTLGQHKNPWKCSMLTYDSDLRPTGATLAYDQDALFANIGAYNLRGDNKVTGSGDQSLANMYGGQVGMKFKGDNLKGLLAAGFHYYDDETGEYQLAADDYNYQIGSLYGEIGGKAGDVVLKALGEFAMNFGADNDFSQGVTKGRASADPAKYKAEDNDMAWLLGFQAKYGKVAAKYSYVYIEGDSVPWFMTDADLGAGVKTGGSVNVQGHVIGLSYDLSKNLSLGGTMMLTELIEPADGNDDDGMLYQLDISYKF